MDDGRASGSLFTLLTLRGSRPFLKPNPSICGPTACKRAQPKRMSRCKSTADPEGTPSKLLASS